MCGRGGGGVEGKSFYKFLCGGEQDFILSPAKTK